MPRMVRTNVDAHRTIAFAISPYIKRHSVDSTLYSTSSNASDDGTVSGPGSNESVRCRGASDVERIYRQPDLTPFTHRPAKVDLDAKNLASAWGADASMNLDLEVEIEQTIWSSTRSSGNP